MVLSMNFDWLKRYMPRGLYGRAALILILPVVTLQLVVSVVFIQRHFEGVTSQMSTVLSQELTYVLSELDQSDDLSSGLATIEGTATGLNFDYKEPKKIGPDQRRWFDFSGLVIMRVLADNVPAIQSIQLPDDRRVIVFALTRHGPIEFIFQRSRASASNPHQLLVNMVFFGGLMTLISIVYMRNQLRPITRLARAAEAFGRGEKVDYHMAGATEIRAAGQSFLDMRARIERHIEQRTLMLSGVSHDLRTPLTRLRLGLSFLDEEDREPLERDVADMQRMLDEFLEFSKDSAEGKSENTDLKSFVRTIVEITAAHGADVTFMRGAPEIRHPIRRVALQRGIENLLNNAVRYGSKAQVTLIDRTDEIVIRVEDDGPGIPADKREEAQKPFARLEAARNQNKVSGVGLGLAITADAARAHGGKLVLSDSPSLGGLSADFCIAK